MYIYFYKFYINAVESTMPFWTKPSYEHEIGNLMELTYKIIIKFTFNLKNKK